MAETPSGAISIVKAKPRHFAQMGEINEAAFLGHRGAAEKAKECIESWLRADKIFQGFVAIIRVPGVLDEEIVAGYIIWQLQGGLLRPDPAVELEQTALRSDFAGKGLGPRLIDETALSIAGYIQGFNNRIQEYITFFVWTYLQNEHAVRAYRKWFIDGIKGHRTIYGEREEVMLRRRIPVENQQSFESL